MFWQRFDKILINMPVKILSIITKILLLSVIIITPFFKISSLYSPYVSGRVYLFRLLVMLAFFFWFWLFVKDKNYQPAFKNILVVAVLLLFLAQTLVSFFGVDPAFSLFSSISRSDGAFQYGFWALYFLIFISVFKKEKDWQAFFSVFLLASFLVSLFAWFGYPPDRELYGNFFGNPAYFGGFLVFSAGFSLLAFAKKIFGRALLNKLFLLLAAFFSVTLIFTQIRGALVGLAAGILLFCVLAVLFLRRENKKLAISCGIILLLGLLSTIILFSAKETAFVKNNRFLFRLTEITEFREIGSARERLLVWNIALRAFQEKPIFGWGPENFGSAFNKYYDWRVGEKEPWFDRVHNQTLEILTGGGILLFSFYLFWLAAVSYIIFRVAKERRILAFILSSVFLAYFLQGFFFFDVFATHLGLFPFLALLVYEYNLTKNGKNKAKTPPPIQHITDRKAKYEILIPAGIFSFFVIYAAVIAPYQANASAIQFYSFTEGGFYKEAKPFLEKSFFVKSPYAYWQVRKETGWQFLRILEDKIGETTAAKDFTAIEEIYNFITPELERFIKNRPSEPQMYYVLARIYRTGFEKLGKEDLAKAETVLKKALLQSDSRREYFDELRQVLSLERKFEEGEKLLQDYAKRAAPQDYFPYLALGHFYFDQEKYDLATEQYEKAKEAGYDFLQILAEYSRYMFSAEKTGHYQKIVDMAKRYLERRGPDADTYFNIAVGYLNLGDKEKAGEFFLKAVELNPKYKEQQMFFLD